MQTLTSMRYAAACLGLAGLTAAQASVVYDWQPAASGTDGLAVTDGRLAVTDAAYRTGQAREDFAYSRSSYPADRVAPNSPVLGLSLTVDAYDQRDIGMAFAPRDAPEPPAPDHDLDVDLGLAPTTATGRMDLYTFESNVSLASDDSGVWTITQFNSDRLFGAPCGNENACRGASGRWVRAAADVAAPGGWPLLLPGALALLGVARRRRRAL